MRLKKVAMVGVAMQAHRSGGTANLIRRTIGWIWKECVWIVLRIRARGKKEIEKTVWGNVMYLSLDDVGVSKTLAVFGKHEPISTELFRQEIKEGMCVVDIGANIGYYALQEARLVGETGRVIAIEPVPDNFARLKRNVERNGYRNVQLHHAAIGDENGTAKIYISRESNWSSLIPRGMHTKSADVQLWTLDTLLKDEPRVDYVRMDVEGYEVQLIKGMRGIMKRCGPGIFMEAHPWAIGSEPFIGLLKDLEDAEYRIKCVVDKAYEYPIVKRRDVIETLSLRELQADPRVAKGEGLFMLFAVPKSK